jgi:hypothetical protein
VSGGGRPAGTPLGRALDIPAGIAYDDLRDVIAAIERVHGDRELPRIPVRLVAGIPEYGRFLYDPVTGQPIGIIERADQRYRPLTVLHEVGHLLDWREFGGNRGFGSAGNPLMHEWHIAVTGSRAFRQLDHLARRGTGRIDNGRTIELTERELLAVTRSLLPDECWARSYAQYGATRSKMISLHRNLESLRARDPRKVYYPLQWDDDDFIPIAEAIDQLFIDMGWRT